MTDYDKIDAVGLGTELALVLITVRIDEPGRSVVKGTIRELVRRADAYDNLSEAHTELVGDYDVLAQDRDAWKLKAEQLQTEMDKRGYEAER